MQMDSGGGARAAEVRTIEVLETGFWEAEPELDQERGGSAGRPGVRQSGVLLRFGPVQTQDALNAEVRQSAPVHESRVGPGTEPGPFKEGQEVHRPPPPGRCERARDRWTHFRGSRTIRTISWVLELFSPLLTGSNPKLWWQKSGK